MSLDNIASLVIIVVLTYLLYLSARANARLELKLEKAMQIIDKIVYLKPDIREVLLPAGSMRFPAFALRQHGDYHSSVVAVTEDKKLALELLDLPVKRFTVEVIGLYMLPDGSVAEAQEFKRLPILNKDVRINKETGQVVPMER